MIKVRAEGLDHTALTLPVLNGREITRRYPFVSLLNNILVRSYPLLIEATLLQREPFLTMILYYINSSPLLVPKEIADADNCFE